MIYASRIIEIESGKIYEDIKISTIHPIMTNRGDVIIENVHGDIVKYPKGSLIGGALYNIHIKRISFDPKKSAFIGYGLNLKI